MNKLEYLLETSEGQFIRFLERWRNRIHLDIYHEPKSKKSINSDEMIDFQKQVYKYMVNKNRRAFRGPIILEFDFYPSANNPPHIHKLPKNYLDLLSKPLKESGIKRNSLLFNDDRQVKLLIVNYHIEERHTNPKISITANRLSNFYEDINLLDKVNSGDFLHNDYNSTYEYEDLFEDDLFIERYRDIDDLLENYRNTKALREVFIENLGEKSYNQLLNSDIFNIQKYFLSQDRFNAFDLIKLFVEYKSHDSTSIHEKLPFIPSSRNLLVSPSFSILEVLNLPTQKGETKVFKERVRSLFRDFKHKYYLLTPLLINVSLTIIYVPPKDQEIDLDNLARYIVPYLNDELQPTSKRFYANEDIKGFTQRSITQYQVIRVPRIDNDPVEGTVRFILNEKEPYQSIWGELDSALFKWDRKEN